MVQPRRHHLAGRVFQAGDVVQVGVVQPREQRRPRLEQDVVEAALAGIGDDAHAETVAVQAAALVAGADVRQLVRGLEAGIDIDVLVAVFVQ
ncbi:hypothetical protein D3C71_2091760 [compost metagenome]